MLPAGGGGKGGGKMFLSLFFCLIKKGERRAVRKKEVEKEGSSGTGVSREKKGGFRSLFNGTRMEGRGFLSNSKREGRGGGFASKKTSHTLVGKTGRGGETAVPLVERKKKGSGRPYTLYPVRGAGGGRNTPNWTRGKGGGRGGGRPKTRKGKKGKGKSLVRKGTYLPNGEKDTPFEQGKEQGARRKRTGKSILPPQGKKKSLLSRGGKGQKFSPF